MDDDIADTFRSNGFEVDEGEVDEGIESFSTNVSWSQNINLKKDNRSFTVYLSGSASANISYDRWTTTDCYSLDTYDVGEIK